MPSETRSRSQSRERGGPLDGGLTTPTTTDDEHVDEQRRARVPRDVRSLSRRFDRHQAESTAAINAMQGEMSKLSAMMSTLLSNTSRNADESSATMDTASAHQSRPFSTPPPRTNTALSPIPEVTTPASTPPAPPPPFPPTLGRLTPEQLPLQPPQHKQPSSQPLPTVTTQSPAPIYTTTPSITSSHPSSSTKSQTFQLTTPNTQPQYYSNTTTQPPSYNPYCIDSHNNQMYANTTHPLFPQNPGFSPFFHPPFPPHPYINPYLYPPPTYFQQPPTQQASVHTIHPQQTPNTNTQEPHLRTPHVEMPLFSGDQARAWILECEDIFSLVGIAAEHRVSWGLAHIRGQAKTWISSAGYNLQRLSWTELCRILLDRFPDSQTADPMEQLQLLKQVTSVNNYIDSYELWMAQMKRERTYLPQDFFVDRFMSGLKDTIKHTVQCQKPESLLSAYWYARQYEKSHLSTTRRPPIPAQPQFRNAPARDNRNRNMGDRPREPRRCWYCPDNWTPGHRCPTMQRALNTIQMQGNSDDEQEEQLAAVHIPDIILPLPQPEAAHVQVPEASENLMNISAAAYNGFPSDSTISVLLQLHGSKAMALADTGSTNTFLDYSFAVKHNIPMTPAKVRKVVVAGGSTLTSDAIAYNCKFSAQGHQFVTDFRILTLQGSDIILGVNWFKEHNPVTFDFIDRTLTIGIEGSPHTFHDHLVPKQDFLISTEQCHKLIEHGATGYILYSSSADEDEPGHVLDTIPESLQNLLHTFQDIFQMPSGLPPHRTCDHHIPLLPEAKPPNIRPYRMSHSQKNSVELLIKEMLKNKEIRPSNSPFSSPAILVRKKDKSWRLCVDFRLLNSMTIKNKFPIPVIEDLLDELHGATIFSKLDLRSGYHQIRMKNEDIHKTAFSTHLGHYEYLVMPFGLSNAPATFQELMNSIFSKLLRKSVLVFFDDILVYSKTAEDHRRHLLEVLNILRTHDLKAKMSKCTFGQPQVEYLGHIISANGVQTDPSKITAIVNWKIPQTVTQLRGFLGLTGYYRRFIKQYALICKPLHDILKKNSFLWGPPQQQAFDTLKKVMSQPPLLALPNFQEAFVLETDACATGLGAVLMQQNKPLAFFSKSLGSKNSAQSIYEKEAMAILEALKKWRHYFLGNRLIIKTDQQSLKYLSSQRLIEGIQHKLMLKLLEFDYSIEYKKGTENLVADALSRQFQATDREQCNAISVSVPTWTTEILDSCQGDQEFTAKIQALAINKDSYPKFTLQAGVLRYKGRICIGSATDLRNKLFTAFHSSIFGGHSGNRVTLHRLKTKFFWPHLKQFMHRK
nr:uncharacterized protein LOC127305750 [Lolium perenne]XP_051192242.1 uncharacterized protein LOC127305750 [Lolium perenne]XP_051192243.1 uncharacterized protein LOC127305750 [Lolium perenne]